MLIHKKNEIPYKDVEARLNEIGSQTHTARWKPQIDDLGQATPDVSLLYKIKRHINRIPIIGNLARRLWPYYRPSRLKAAITVALQQVPPAHRLVRWAYHVVKGPRRQNELYELLLEFNHRTFVLQEQLQALSMNQRQDRDTLLHQGNQLRKYQQDMQRIEDVIRLLPTQAQRHEATANSAESAHSPFIASALDRFYKAFEDRFRGKEADISQRLLDAYSDILETLPSNCLAIDLGCGRGEWLTLLNSRGFNAVGVDITASMVERCHSKGLAVELADAASYLEGLKPGSVHLVTAFHVAEHLPFPKLLELIVLARRALCEGGILILETPNPENLQVGANTFYMDPTHLNPLPPALLAFAAQSQGFERTHIKRLHPFNELDAGTHTQTDALLYGPQDYAMIAWK